MRKDLFRGALALALTVAVAACDDEGPTDGQEGELTTAEAEALAAAVVGLGAAASQGSDGGSQNVYAPQDHGGDHYEQTLEVTVPCPLGGEVDVEASVTGTTYPEEDRTVVDMQGSQTHAECGVEADGEEFVVSGDPNLSWSMHLEVVGEEPSGPQTFEYGGGFAWSTANGRTGTCTVDLAAEIDPEAQTGTLSGTFCGVEIESTASWTDA